MDLVAYILARNAAGSGGGGGGGSEEGQDKSYIHTQRVASTEWSITHRLDKYPSVTIVDSGGNAVMGEVQYLSKQTVKVTFSAAFAGTAYLN